MPPPAGLKNYVNRGQGWAKRVIIYTLPVTVAGHTTLRAPIGENFSPKAKTIIFGTLLHISLFIPYFVVVLLVLLEIQRSTIQIPTLEHLPFSHHMRLAKKVVRFLSKKSTTSIFL